MKSGALFLGRKVRDASHKLTVHEQPFSGISDIEPHAAAT